MNNKTIAIIPARGNSKRLPGKNTKFLGGIPLLAHSIKYAQQFSFIDCIDILEHIQTELHHYLPTLPIYMVTEEQSKRRKARAIALAEKEGR